MDSLNNELLDTLQQAYDTDDFEVLEETSQYKIIYFKQIPVFEVLRGEAGLPNYYLINKNTGRLENATSNITSARHTASVIFDTGNGRQLDLPGLNVDVAPAH